MYAAIAVGFIGLGAILFDVARDGLPRLSWDFLTRFPSRIIPERSGIQSALVGTLYLMAICAVLVVPLGVATAIYLEEYADRKKWFNRLIEVNIQNLAAVPSVVYGILGLAFIVRGPLSMGRVLLAAGSRSRCWCSGRDHRRAGGHPGRAAVDPRRIAGAGRDPVADDLEAGPAGLGGRHRHGGHPRPVTGDRETAPLLIIGAAVSPRFNPSGLFDSFTALPIQIFSWTTDADREFVSAAAGAILVLMVLLVLMNSIAIFLRNRYEQKW